MLFIWGRRLSQNVGGAGVGCMLLWLRLLFYFFSSFV